MSVAMSFCVKSRDHQQARSACNANNDKQTPELINAPTFRTWTGLRVAILGRFACTIIAGIRRRWVGASSGLSPAATSFRAGAETGPSAAQLTTLCNVACNAADGRVSELVWP